MSAGCGGSTRSWGRRAGSWSWSAAPDKGALEPEFIPDDYPQKDCAVRAHQDRVAALSRLGVPSLIDMQGPLAALKRKTPGGHVYLPTDSHWIERGRLLYGRLIAEALDPRLMEHTKVVESTRQEFVGDLTKLTGDPKTAVSQGLSYVRDGVSDPVARSRTLFPGAGQMLRERRTTTGPARLYQGRTLVLGDSFTGVSWTKLSRFFADITQFPELIRAAEAGRLPETESVLFDEIRRARVVIYEHAERNFWGERDQNVLLPRFLDRLERALR